MIGMLRPIIRGNGVYPLLKGQQADNRVGQRFRLFPFREFFHQQKACLSLGQCYYGTFPFLAYNRVYLPVSEARTGIHYRRTFVYRHIVLDAAISALRAFLVFALVTEVLRQTAT